MMSYLRSAGRRGAGIGLALVVAAGSADAATHRARLQRAAPDPGRAAVAELVRGEHPGVPPEPWIQSDPGEEEYRRGRSALNAGRYREAAAGFARLRQEHPESGYVPASLYWEAFARYRLDDDEQLRLAAELLTRQMRNHADAPTTGEARSLLVRIQGELARRGDAESAAAVSALAREGLLLGEQATAAAAEARRAAVEALGSSGMETALTESVRAGMEGAREALEAVSASGVLSGSGSECVTDGQQLRVAALNALMHMDDDRALPVLERTLEQRGGACEAELREKAVFLLSQHDSDRAAELLLRVVRDDPGEEVRKKALFWLGQMDSRRAVDAIEEVLESPADSALHERAIFALAQNDSERSGKLLQEYALRSDAPAELRKKAIFWLGQGGDAVPLSFFRTLWTRLEERELKERVLFAVSQADDEAARKWLLEVARDGSEPTAIRKKALFWAGQGGVAVEELSELYDAMDDREMREQVIFVLSQRDAPEAVGALMEVARSDPDSRLRKKAIFWLGQSDDPRVTDFLMELVNDPPEER